VPARGPVEEQNTAASRKALAGFLVSGVLLSFLGAILPSWGYHLRFDFDSIGTYFLALNLGLLMSVRFAEFLLPRRGISFVLVIACALAFCVILYFSFTAPPVEDSWRFAGFVGLGIAAGLLNTAVFQAISPLYRRDPAATVNLAGTFFGLGCLLVTLLVAGTFNTYTVSSILFLVALIPGFFAIAYAKTSFPARAPANRATGTVSRHFRSPGAVLFSLLLFFQFGNEWSIAGWLPLFLIQRLGVSPQTSLLILALYWSALLIGRILAQWVLPVVSHGRLLMGSVVAGMFGCVILAFTNNVFGACMGTLMVGFGYSMIYPLVVEKIGTRFPSYHPGYFNGIFSFALTGGMLAPWMLGYAAQSWGIRIVVLLPMLGSMMVFLLLLLIWLGAKIRGSELPQLETHRT
jgi:fucose permease